MSINISLLFASEDYFLHYVLYSPNILHIARFFLVFLGMGGRAISSNANVKKGLPIFIPIFVVHIFGFSCLICCSRLHGFNCMDLISKSMFFCFSSFLFLLTSTQSLCSWYLQQQDSLVSCLSLNHNPCL